jgi:hypothetical protein
MQNLRRNDALGLGYESPHMCVLHGRAAHFCLPHSEESYHQKLDAPFFSTKKKNNGKPWTRAEYM